MSGVYAVIVAAGRGTRMGAAVNKVLLPLEGRPVLRRAAAAFCAHPAVDGAVVVAQAGEIDAVRRALRGLNGVMHIVPGEETRQQSVLNGLRALPGDAGLALVHDGARPLICAGDVTRLIEAARQYGSAVACTPVTDTIKVSRDGWVESTPPRAALRAVQTPQCFAVAPLIDALERAAREGAAVTDEASAMERLGRPVRLVECARSNIKITAPEDLAIARALLSAEKGEAPAPRLARTGFGYDVHRLVPGRRLMLCGVQVAHEKGLEGHSDADVAVHALMDALLGAACLGDIGRLYPDSDPAYAGADSMALLEDVVRRVHDAGYVVVHADVTIVAQRPKLQEYMPRMAARLEGALPGARVNVKATTTERLGFEGRGEGIAAQAVATIW